MISVLVTSQYGMVVKGIQGLLNSASDLKVVGGATTTDETIKKYRQLRPDVLVADVVQLARALEGSAKFRANFPKARSVVLTGIDDPAVIRALLDRGVLGMVSKSSSADELIIAVRYASQGRKFLDPILVDKLVDGPSNGRRPDCLAGLSKRESEVLHAILTGNTRRQIAAQLQLSVKTVETYRARVYTKLHINSRYELIQYAITNGLIALPERAS